MKRVTNESVWIAIFALTSVVFGMVMVGCGKAPPPTIQVSEASYGKNLGASETGNVTKVVQDECNGKTTCNFPVSRASRTIGDKFVGQRKDFDASYLCGDKAKTVHVNGESSTETAVLTCVS